MEVFIDCLLDTLKVFPFILVIYILIELFEHKASFIKNKKLLQGNLAPLAGTLTGIIPQCGFSVMAAKLYEGGLITAGTLLAVFIATSDEALIILVTNPAGIPWVLPLIAVKIAAGVVFGYAANIALRGKTAVPVRPVADVEGYSCGREHDGKSNIKLYLVEPLVHSLKIALYIFAVTLVFGYVFEYNHDAIIAAFVGGPYVEPLITSAIGLIPNCASSAVLAQTFCSGGITFGGLAAGLCCNAGLGFVVLLKDVKKIKRNLLLIVTVYAISVLVGIAVNGICLGAGWV